MVLSTEWSQVELIELINEGHGLGFMLVGGRSTGVVIKAVIPGGAAERDGRMQAGDHVLQINDVALRGFSSDQVAQVLRQTGQQVRLIVARSVEPASVDFQALTSHAPIIPTKLLSDPEELDRILQQTGGYTTQGTTTTTEHTMHSTIEEVVQLPPLLIPPPQSQAVPAIVSTTIIQEPLHNNNISRSITESTTTPTVMLKGGGGGRGAGGGTIAATSSSSDLVEVISRPNYCNNINNNSSNNKTNPVTCSPSSSTCLPATPAAGLSNGGGQQLLAKRPSDIALPNPSSVIQCDGIDSTTTCSSEEGGLDGLNSPETEVYQVELHKNVYGLGITVAGYVCEEEDLSGIFVKSIIEGSAAEISGIQINDRIVEVNGRSLNGVTNHQAVDILRQTDIAVNLKLERFLRGRKFEHLQTALTEMRIVGTSTPNTPMGSRSSIMKTPRQSMGSTKSMDLILEEKRSSEDSLEESKGAHKKPKKQVEGGGGGGFSSDDDEQVVALEDIHSCSSNKLNRSIGSHNRSRPPSVDSSTHRRRRSEEEDDRSPLVVSEEVPLGGGGMVVIENEMESHTTIDSAVYANDYVINGDEVDEDEDDNELVMIEAANNHSHYRMGTGTVDSPPYHYQDGGGGEYQCHHHHHQSQRQQQQVVVEHQDPLIRHWQSELSPESKVIVVELHKLSGLGISLEGTVEVDGGVELHPHHYIRSILEEGPVGKNGILRPGDELLQVNEHRLQGRKHIEVVQIIKELPRQVKIVCARGKKPPSVINTSQSPEAFEARSILGPGGLKSLQNLLTTKAQSESSLYTSSTATLTDQQRSKSFEQVSGLALWTCDVVYVDVEKTDAGFGFSILDYQDPLDPDGTVIVIRGLIPGGAAEATNLIFPGDRLLYVNSVNLHGMTLDQAVAVLKCVSSGSRVRLGLCRPLSTSDSNIDDSPQSAAETPTT